MQNKFERAIEFTLKWEGGFTIDTGGETKYGISKKAFPYLDIKNLSLERAKDIYYTNYWKPLYCDEYKIHLSMSLFDMAVNIGKKRAVKFLQIICNILNEDKLKIDGILGNHTFASSRYCDIMFPLKTTMLLNNERYKYYCMLASRPKYRKYLLGWINRVNDLNRNILSI